MVVHGFLAGGGQIGLWAETSDVPADADDGAHPFAVAPAVAGDAGEAVLRLPSHADGPLPSPDLDPTVRATSGAAAWSVPAVLLHPGVDPEAVLEESGARCGA